MNPYRYDEEKRNGWTLWREIYGTFIGAAAIVIPLTIGAVKYVGELETRVNRIEGQLVADAQATVSREAYRLERDIDREGRLKRIEAVSDRIESRLNELVVRQK